MTWMIVLEPGHGRVGQGVWDPGVQAGSLVEADLAWELSQGAEEELQRSGVRHKLLDVRSGEGLLLKQRMESCPHNGTLVSIHFESLPRPGYNGGRVYAGPHPESIRLAERLALIIESWGRVTSSRYHSCTAHANAMHPWLQREDAPTVMISPFSLTAPDAIIYARRLRALGPILGGLLASWGIGRNPAIRSYQPLTAQRDVGRGPSARNLSEMFRGRSESPQTNDTVRQISTVSQDESSE